MRDAPDTLEHLRAKFVLLVGFYGALRVDDLSKLTWEVTDFQKEGIWVELKERKTGVVQDGHRFLLPACLSDVRVCPVSIARKYQTLLSNKATGRIFLSIRNGKFTSAVLGKNKLREIPKFIALFLGLEAPERFTGQCFRRSSATSLADSGISRTNLKRHGGWRSDTVAEGYLHDSKKMRVDIAEMLSENSVPQNTETPSSVPSPVSSSSHPVFNFNFNNCTNVNVNQPSPLPNLLNPHIPNSNISSSFLNPQIPVFDTSSSLLNKYNSIWGTELSELDLEI